MQKQEEYLFSYPGSHNAIKKTCTSTIAIRTWKQMNDNKNENDLLNQISNVLGPGQFSLDSLLFYFRYDSEVPHQVKKNGKQIFYNTHLRRTVLAKPPEFEKEQKNLITSLSLQARQQRIYKPFDVRLWVMAHFYFPKTRYYTKNGRIANNLPDLSNLLELPADCMQEPKICQTGQKKGRTLRLGAGIIENDNQIDSWDGSRRIPWDQEIYRLELFLLRYGGHHGSLSN